VSEYFLMGNAFTTVNPAAFSQKTMRIDLSNCALAALPPGLFALPLLRYLCVARNVLTELPPQIESSKLILLNLSGNPLAGFPRVLPPTLEQLFVSACGLTEVPDTLDRNADLVELNLSANYLESLPNLPNLLVLNVSENRLTNLPRLPSSLASLDVSFNPLSAVPTRLPNLEYLDLSGTAVRRLPRLRMPLLRTLKAAGCRLCGKLDLSLCTSLAYVDASQARATIDAVAADCQILLLPSSQSPRSAAFQPLDWSRSIAYATGRGSGEFIDDVPFTLRRDDATWLGLFDGRFGGRSARGLSQLAHSILRSSIPLPFHELQKRLGDMNSDAANFDGCDFVLAIRSGEAISVLAVGNIAVLIVGDATVRPVIEPSLSTGRIAAKLRPSKVVGDRLVFNVDAPVGVQHVRIEEGDRFLILASATVVAATDHAGIMTICGGRAPMEIAAALRNRAMAVMHPENAGVIVMDLQGTEEDQVENDPDGEEETDIIEEYSHEEERAEEQLLLDNDTVIESVLIDKFDDESESSSSEKGERDDVTDEVTCDTLEWGVGNGPICAGMDASWSTDLDCL
jgi:hypothetical protein